MSTAWRWEDAPAYPVVAAGDLPKIPQRMPRYVPEPELTHLMDGVRALECPYQRAALLIARWCGARRDEIRRLAHDCLDAYPGGIAAMAQDWHSRRHNVLVSQAIRIFTTSSKPWMITARVTRGFFIAGSALRPQSRIAR